VERAPPLTLLLAEVLDGLGEAVKQLPPKLFYDAHGSDLFRAICGTDAYYLTRTEQAILRDRAQEIAHALGTGCTVLEPGAGDMHKIRLLLPALEARRYVAFDIAREQLLHAAGALAGEFPALDVVAVHGDFTFSALGNVLPAAGERRVLFFPGSTLGNFDPEHARSFLSRGRMAVGRGGKALIGVDLVKPASLLGRAYNDPEGFTARFNLNLLARLNRELEADFDLTGFAHRAFFNWHASRVEMHLVSLRRQTVTIVGRRFEFDAGETIHTENCYKYTPESFGELAAQAGWKMARQWSDASNWFGVFLLEAG
jgi:dimethylhistidine N-methyltransferase